VSPQIVLRAPRNVLAFRQLSFVFFFIDVTAFSAVLSEGSLC
jgi:hypothetical protein